MIPPHKEIGNKKFGIVEQDFWLYTRRRTGRVYLYIACAGQSV
jgi:hypothetical protein